jgi:hypothetical protein
VYCSVVGAKRREGVFAVLLLLLLLRDVVQARLEECAGQDGAGQGRMVAANNVPACLVAFSVVSSRWSVVRGQWSPPLVP